MSLVAFFHDNSMLFDFTHINFCIWFHHYLLHCNISFSLCIKSNCNFFCVFAVFGIHIFKLVNIKERWDLTEHFLQQLRTGTQYEWICEQYAFYPLFASPRTWHFSKLEKKRLLIWLYVKKLNLCDLRALAFMFKPEKKKKAGNADKYILSS